MEHELHLMAGAALAVLGLSLLVRTRDWIDWLDERKRHGRSSALSLGSVNLLLGSFVLAFHPIWKGWPMLLSLLGALMLLRGILLLLFPGVLPALIRREHKYFQRLITLSGVICLLLGLLFLYGWYEPYALARYWPAWTFA